MPICNCQCRASNFRAISPARCISSARRRSFPTRSRPHPGRTNSTVRESSCWQGTVANHNFNLLVGPTLAALANEPDVLVVATAGGRPIDAIPGPLPSNARVSSYLPFEWLLPKVDVLVTNGGYGSVSQAMSFGIPLVTAGLTEDKADVNARVAWSGVGMNLATNEPSRDALRRAVKTVLDQPGYRLRARQMADQFAAIDTRSEIPRIVSQVVADERELSGADTLAAHQPRRAGQRS